MNDLFDWKKTPERTRADQILDAFERFHTANPAVWRLFLRFSNKAMESGFKHYSANAIFERIRWHIEIETSGEEVKLNNNFRAHYARMFHLAYPQYDGFFRNRKLVSEGAQAAKDDVQVFDSGRAEEEKAILDRLGRILKASCDVAKTSTP